MIEKLTHPKVCTFIKEHVNDDAAELMLKAHRYPDLPMAEISEQILSRQKAKRKLPEWVQDFRLVFPAPSKLEQASSEITAKFKSRHLTGNRFVDLTGGTGIDAYYISAGFKKSWFVEKDSTLCSLAAHNFECLGREVCVVNSDAEQFLHSTEPDFDLIYIDPSRRDRQRNRVYDLQDCEPDVFQLSDLLLARGKKVLIKASPMLDITSILRRLERVYKVQVVAVHNEVKEILIWMKDEKSTEALIEACDLRSTGEESSFSFCLSEEKQAAVQYSLPDRYIYEPNSAIMKSGAFNLVAQKFDLLKLHPNTHLYTSDRIVEDFPGRIFELKQLMKPSARAFKKLTSCARINVLARNYPLGANEIKKRYRLKDGGDDYLYFCTLLNGEKRALHLRLRKAD